MSETKRATKVKGGRVRVYPKLSPEEYAQLKVLQKEGETEAGVMLRGLNLLWEHTAKREGMR